jgi:hypothetical protein
MTSLRMARRPCKNLFIIPAFLFYFYFYFTPVSGFVPGFPLTQVRGVKQDNKLLATTITPPLPPSTTEPKIEADEELQKERKSIDAIRPPELLLAPEPPKTKNFLIHRGRSAAMIKRSPSIAGIGLCRGWNEESTRAFTKAVEKLGTRDTSTVCACVPPFSFPNHT